MRAKWIKRPSTFDMPQCIINLKALYTNYKHTGLWDKTVPNHKAQLIDLATHLKEKMNANKSTCRKNPSKPKPAAICAWDPILSLNFAGCNEK